MTAVLIGVLKDPLRLRMKSTDIDWHSAVMRLAHVTITKLQIEARLVHSENPRVDAPGRVGFL